MARRPRTKRSGPALPMIQSCHLSSFFRFIVGLCIVLIFVGVSLQFRIHGNATATLTEATVDSTPHVVRGMKLRHKEYRPRMLQHNYAKCSSMLEGKANVDKSLLPTLEQPVVNNSLPYLIIHIGPSKTATTTLQKDSVRASRSLALDGYVYLGRYAPQSLRGPAQIANLFRNDFCITQLKELHQLLLSSNATLSEGFAHTNTSTINVSSNLFAVTQSLLPENASDIGEILSRVPCWQERVGWIRQQYAANNTNIIISDEAYSYERMWDVLCSDPWFLPTIKAALEVDWNIIVVPTYRRYAEWLVSGSKETNRKFCLENDNENDKSLSKLERLWPHEGGQQCWTTWEHIDPYLWTTNGFAHGYINLDLSIPAWSQRGTPVRVLNVHGNNTHVTTSFYCNIVPNAPYTCRHFTTTNNNNNNVSANAHTTENVQSVISVAYNDIVFEAAKIGLLSDIGNQTRQEFTRTLANFSNNIGLVFTDLPLNCPTQDWLSVLLRKSLAMERALVPDFYAHSMVEHKRRFWRMANEEKVFCAVDSERLLRNVKSWPDVLRRLEQLVRTRIGTHPV